MKKTLIALMALPCVAVADIKDGVQWAESFGDGYSQDATFGLKNAFHTENGVGVAGGDYKDSRVWTTNTGGKFSDAFTFSFKLVDLDANNWTDALSLYTNGATSGSHKLNSAIAQAYYAKQQGLKGVTTETGAGQWGTALSMACAYLGLDCKVFMVKCSYEQKPFRREVMRTYGANVTPSPSMLTEVGRKITSNSPEQTVLSVAQSPRL